MKKSHALISPAGLLTMLLSILLTLSGCGGASPQTPSNAAASDSPSEAPSAPTSNDLLRVGTVTEIDSIDPHISVSAGARELLFNVFEGLIKPDRYGNLQPAIAQEFSVSADAMTYSFTLRNGVRFHDGSVVTIEDVASSLRRVAEEMDDGILVHAAFGEVREIRTPDDSHLDVLLKRPNTEFLPQLTIAAIIPADNDPESAPVGTGPYRIASYAANMVELERFDDYWGTPAFVDKVVWSTLPNWTAVSHALQAGEIDLAWQLPYGVVRSLSDDYEIYEGAMNLVQGLYLNHAFAPFANPLVRQALCYATERQALFDEVFDGFGVPVGSAMYPAFGKYFMPELSDAYPADTERAKEKLAEAGYPDGFSFTITVPSNYVQHTDTAKCLAEQYAKVGLNATVREVDWATWLAEVFYARQYEATVIALDATTLSASAMLGNYESNAANNFINYRSDAFDETYARAIGTADDAERTELFRQCEQILTDEAASVFLQDPANFAALNRNFSGYEFYPLPAQNLARIRPAA